MNTQRKLAEGLAGWLMFEFHSSRGRLFSEKYLTAPIGNILAGTYRELVMAEWPHPILNQHHHGPGRPPQIDFAIVDKKDKNKIMIAVESKWIGKTTPNFGDIIWDLIRLELLHKNYGTQCFFIIGGTKRRLNEMFKQERFQEPSPKGSMRPILRTERHKKQGIRLDNPPPKRAGLIKAKLSQYQDILMPSGISTGYPVFYPQVCRNGDFQVYVWEIGSFRSKPRFYPRNNELYADVPIPFKQH